MKWLRIFSDRVRALRDRDAVIGDIDEEMRLHVEMETGANIERGMSPAAAREAALRSFGNIGSLRDQAYEVRGGGMIETLWQDIKYAARGLAKHKAFTAVAVITLALGIGANTAIFSVVNELLLRPLPYADAERLVMLWEVTPEGRNQNTTSRANFRGWREQNTTFEKMSAFTDQRLNLTGVGEAEEITVQFATPELFDVLGVQPFVGRGMTAADGQAGASQVAILGYGIWQRRFGGDPTVVGKQITLNGASITVAGVLPRSFQWHIKSKSGTGRAAEIWMPLTMPTEGPGVRGRFLSAVGRLKPGVSIEQAAADLKTIHARLEQDSPQFNHGYRTEVIPLREQFVGNVRIALWILLGAVGFVLLIACANVANLVLSRAAARAKEIALRTALGASRTRIIRQLLTESLMLALLGSISGLLLAWWGMRALVAISPRDLISLQSVGINFTVLAWTLGISLLTGVVFGLAPALEATRLNLNDSLKEGGKGTGGEGARGRRLRGAFVVTEVALALVLLASAGLLIKSFLRMQAIDTGFNTDNVLTMVLRLPAAKYKTDPEVVTFFRNISDRVKTLPGVESAGIVNYLPLYGGLGAATGFTVEGRPPLPPGRDLSTNVRVSDADYFKVMRIPLLRGRNFTDAETREVKSVVLISESLAQKYFPGEEPLGQRVKVQMSEKPVPAEIIGIVGDVRYDSLIDNAEPTTYMPHPDLTYEFMTLVIRTSGDPTALAPAVQREVRSLDPEQPISDVRTMNQVMAETVGRARFSTLLLGLFAALATVLAAVGIFGVMNYSLSLRTREIGLRMALGAQPAQVLVLMLRQGLSLTLIGTVIGLASAFALTRLLSSLLFGVTAADPATFGGIVVLLIIVSLIACYLPARRAMRIDPLIALRSE